MKIVIGTRGSKLALWQATWVKDRLAAHGHEIAVKVIKTTGDTFPNLLLTQSDTKGLFIKEIEEALLNGSVDLAVHSMKDLPVQQTPGLLVAAVAEREDARDVIISRNGEPFATLRMASRVGTSSLRRQSQLRALRPDLEIIPMRGNVDTRLKKLERGDCDALSLAAAGLRRLGLAARITDYLEIQDMCPAVGQGALAIEIRQGDVRTEAAVKPLDHPATHVAVRAERAALTHLGGGCQVPIAAHAFAEHGKLRLLGVVANPDGTAVIRASALGPPEDPESLGAILARDLLKQGARELLAAMVWETPERGLSPR